MWLSLFTVIAGIVVFMIEFPKMKKAKQKKEMIIFTTILSIGVVLNILRFMEMEIPSPLDAIVYLFHPIVKTIYQVLT